MAAVAYNPRPRYRGLGALGVWAGPPINGAPLKNQPPQSEQVGEMTDQSVPDPSAPIMTTQDVNGPSGSVDGGGAVDQCAWWLSAEQQQGWVGQQVQKLVPANMYSNERFGVPLALPTLQSMLSGWHVLIIGGFLGGFHGYKRSHGKGLPTAGYALAGAFFPLLTLGVSVIQGYGQSKR